MTQQLRDLIVNARPGTTIRIIEIEVPGEPDSIAEFALASEGREDDPAAGGSAWSPERGYSHREQRLRELQQLANGPLKLTEWPGVIKQVWAQAISERELERAISAGAIAARTKGEGKDHRATVVEPDAMAEYLTLCDAVQHGKEPRPHWWADVRKGLNASIK